MPTRASPRLQQLQHQSIEQKLLARVDPAINAYWTAKIQNGIVPNEKVNRADFTKESHERVLDELASFESETATIPLKREWSRDNWPSTDRVLYYGPGTAHGISKFVPAANKYGYSVIVHDVSDLGCEKARYVLDAIGENAGSGVHNEVYQSDITHSLRKEFVHPETVKLLIASRVLDILDKQEPDWEIAHRHGRCKAARTAIAMGRLLRYFDVFLIHRCPDDNHELPVMHGDSMPHSLEMIRGCMAKGAKAHVTFDTLGMMTYYGHILRAALFHLER